MDAIRRAGYESTTERSLYTLGVAEPLDVVGIKEFPTSHFACFIAWDALQSSKALVTSVVERLLYAGATYICAWGPGCNGVHDVADEARESQCGGADDRAHPVVMTTSHASDSLQDALWVFLFLTFPDERFEEPTRSGLAITIGNSVWEEQIRQALQDPAAFAGRALASKPPKV